MNYKHILGKIFKSKDSPNIILSGYYKINKLSILFDYISKDNNKYTKYSIDYIYHRDYKIFNMITINKSKEENFFKLLNENIQCKNYYSDFKMIILDNFNLISNKIQDKFRVIFEKYRTTTMFIIITDKLNSIINPIQSRFLTIRINEVSPIEKRKLSRCHFKDLPYIKKSKIYDKIYKLSDISDIKNYSVNHEGILLDHKDIYMIIHEIIINIKDVNERTILLIKKLSYYIEKYNIKYFHKELLNILMNNGILTINTKSKLCKCLVNNEYNYIKSNNKILSNETLFINLVSILNEP